MVMRKYLIYLSWVVSVTVFVSFFSGCIITRKQPSIFDTQPDLVTKQYTLDEIKVISHNFDANPLKYSQQLTNLLEQRSRSLPEPAALHLTRREDHLEIKVANRI
jgi:hypothetical protein